MMNRNRWIGAALIVAFVISIILVMYRNTLFDSQATAFMAQGARFTAADGQALCERVAALERHAGLNPLPCHYGEK